MSKIPVKRLEPVLPGDWTPEMLEALEAFPEGRDFVLSHWPKKGYGAGGMNGLCLLLRNPELARVFLTFNRHIVFHSSLPARVTEMLILRIGWLRRAEYEYVQHLGLGRRAGLTEEELEQLRVGPDAPAWGALDAAVVRAADELHADAMIAGSTWATLAEHFSEPQMMDIVFTVGCYDLLAMVFKSFGSVLEDGVDPLPPDLRERLYAQP